MNVTKKVFYTLTSEDRDEIIVIKNALLMLCENDASNDQKEIAREILTDIDYAEKLNA